MGPSPGPPRVIARDHKDQLQTYIPMRSHKTTFQTIFNCLNKMFGYFQSFQPNITKWQSRNIMDLSVPERSGCIRRQKPLRLVRAKTVKRRPQS